MFSTSNYCHNHQKHGPKLVIIKFCTILALISASYHFQSEVELVWCCARVDWKAQDGDNFRLH